jgi:hypothetical protein
MKSEKNTYNSSQIIFKELFVGTLIYAVVLGFLMTIQQLLKLKVSQQYSSLV